MTNKIVQLQDEQGNNIFPISAGGSFLTPNWDTIIIQGGAFANDTILTATGTSGRKYNFRVSNSGAGIVYIGPNSTKVLETYSNVVFSSPINNTELALSGLKANSKIWSMVNTTIVGGSGTGSRSRTETATADDYAYAPMVGIGSSVASIWMHTLAQRYSGSDNSDAWTLFCEANIGGDLTNYSGAVECTARNSTSVPAMYVRYSGGNVAHCYHIVKIFCED